MHSDKAHQPSVRQEKFAAAAETQSEEEVSLTRRKLIQSGWAVPVVLAAGLSNTAAALSPTSSDDDHDGNDNDSD